MKVLLLALLTAAGLVVLGSPAQAAPVSTEPPSISGTAEYGATLVADPGAWTPTPTGYSYRWLRDGTPISGAVGSSYTPDLDDLGRRLAVQVSATDGSGTSAPATSAPTAPVARARLTPLGGQKVVGVPRYTRTLVARLGRWSAEPTRVRYQWLRAGVPVPGATGRRHRVAPEDVGSRLRVELTVKAPGHEELTVRTDPTPRVRHRVDVRRVVRYHVETRGRITTSLRTFVAQAQQTFDDPRGWRGAGVELRRVARGGAMTLVLSEAARVPDFSSVCSSEWSCRVGRFVIINQERWKHASPAWRAGGGSLRDYRHMVVNHESGHWLGRGHAGCPGPGRLAPVMMQQSKGLGGCRFNPWPTAGELAALTPGPGRAMADHRDADYARGVSSSGRRPAVVD